MVCSYFWGGSPGFKRCGWRCAQISRRASLGESGHCYGWNSSAPGHSSSSPGDSGQRVSLDFMGMMGRCGFPQPQLKDVDATAKGPGKEPLLIVTSWSLYLRVASIIYNIWKHEMSWRVNPCTGPVTDPRLIWVRHLPCEGWIFLQ